MTRTKVANQRFSRKQWFAGGAQSRGFSLAGCGHCYLRLFLINHTAAMLSPEGVKTFVFVHRNSSQTFQLEARGTKTIVYGQCGRRANKAHSKSWKNRSTSSGMREFI